ncbi:MAG: hypothetical protein AB7N24_09135 [Dehalococcoidia bacterium]
MSDLDNYWKRKVAGQGYSRRRVLGGAGVAAVGLGALGLVGCGDDDDDDTGGTATTAPSGTTAAGSPTAGPTTAAKPPKGGTLHQVSANNTWDTFDIDRSRFSPVA